MAKLKQKLDTFNQALNTLNESISFFNEYKEVDKKNYKMDRIFLAVRDSMIQRFEYCTDLFWKVLKFYLQDIERVEIQLLTPRGIIRDAVSAKIITEAEGEECMYMIKKRNETSHIYHEDIAEAIAEDIPHFYKLMHTIINRIAQKN